MKVNVINWSPKHATLIGKFRDELLADSSPKKGILKNVAIKTEAFPIYGDVGGCLLLRSDGQVFCCQFALDERDELVTDDFDKSWLDFAWSEAVRLYPSLLENLTLKDVS